MSGDESFVILGTSPNSSMDLINSLSIEQYPNAAQPVEELNGGSQITFSQLTGSSSSNKSACSVLNNVVDTSAATTNGTINGELIADSVRGQLSNGLKTPIMSNSMKQSSGSNSSAEGSLATNFILGEINSDVIKANLFSQFPSALAGASTDTIRQVLSSFLELKKSYLTANSDFKQLYEEIEKWKSEVEARENQQRIEIAKLRNENLELRQDLKNKENQININEEVRRKEYDELVKRLSEKSAQIANMSAQIQKLEENQLATFVCVPKNPNQTTESTESTEYVTSLEHKRVIKQFQEEISEIVAENLELKEMQTHYIDEINCLKVNLVAAEELQRKAQGDINYLKASELQKNDAFIKFEKDRTEMKDEIGVLRHQVDLYIRDFKIEQEARENLANEKGQLLTDLRELQKKNQELIEEAQKNYEEHARQAMAATGAFPKTRTQGAASSSPKPDNPIYTPTTYNCPVCGAIFKTLSVLQNHVNQCLDTN